MPKSEWEAVGETGMKKGRWTVGKFCSLGVWKYRLWDGDKPIGWFDSFDQCKEVVRNSQKAP